MPIPIDREECDMFVNAIEKAIKFTRPIYTISRNYGSEEIQAGAATLFFINSEGWALTCAHVAKQIMIGNQLLKNKEAFQSELKTIPGNKAKKKWKKELERKYKYYNNNSTYELYFKFINCFENISPVEIEIQIHKKIDVALIHFKKYTKLLCDSFPVFVKDSSVVKPGKSVCRLGYPFVEFTNYKYDVESDSIKWTEKGKVNTPYFPIEGMVTRRLGGPENKIIGFELSTPGLRGQSGGPAFDIDGRIVGMQAATGHLDMNFDIEQNVLRQGKKKQVKDYAFLHVGHCINVETLKEFMKEKGVDFQEG